MLATALLVVVGLQMPRPASPVRGDRRDRGRGDRTLVPQLLPNYTAPTLPPPASVGCGPAWLACNYRAGCGAALARYSAACGSLARGEVTDCGTDCRLALAALVSTVEGARLMECECGDTACSQEKVRVLGCRAEVARLTSPHSSQLSCTVAAVICQAEPGCQTALQYYNRNCRGMFAGRGCGRRCQNSVDILARQPAAARLLDCRCEGTEDWECEEIKQNMARLCKPVSQQQSEPKTEKKHTTTQKINKGILSLFFLFL